MSEDRHMTDCKFRIGINMAGAVSAGAYTAGVLDFLMEAIEEWQAAKEKFRAGAAGAPPVPLHDIEIQVFSGASAGGMCAAIASVMVQQPFQHIVAGDEQNTNNTFYESWVNRIDISQLLKTDDVGGGKPLISLLDCTIIDDIANFALTPSRPQPRPYIASDLTLFLSLTNVRGVPYRLYDDPNPTVNEFTAYYGDKLRFETTIGDAKPQSEFAKALPAGESGKGSWDLLKLAAKATGAVPVALASRVIPREVADYAVPGWESIAGDPPRIPPAFPPGIPSTMETLVVDGGVTNNSPFSLAHDYLAAKNPEAQLGHNPTTPGTANAAVITVAPFPMLDTFDPAFKAAEQQGLWSILGKTFGVTLAQSRFIGEHLDELLGKPIFSRFSISPSDPDMENQNALQCATLNAFGGFFSREFRKHDFLLGRRNCQQFLRAHLKLPMSNPVIDEGLKRAGGAAAALQRDLCSGPPSADPSIPRDNVWMPVIPLVGSAALEVPMPARAQMTTDEVGDIATQIMQRLNAIRDHLVPGKIGVVVSKALGFVLDTWIIKDEIHHAIKDQLIAALGTNVKQS